jgi:hypothetical protein
MITKEDEKRIAIEAEHLGSQPLTNRAFLLGVAYLCRALDNLRLETRSCDEFPDEVGEFLDELNERLIMEFTLDKEKVIDPHDLSKEDSEK